MRREMTFENFYVHEGNEVAYLAAQKVIAFPGELFNPFYVYSGTGLGKTHLLRALHIELSEKIHILFFTAKEFEKFIEENKRVDTSIIIDDLHIITPKYQKILWSMIDTALANGRQVCFSGNLAPRDIKGLDTKLVSRLEGGLVCDLQPPKEMILMDMIKKKSEDAGLVLPDDVALELAQLSSGSIRSIEGMINRLRAYFSIGHLALDINSVRSVLKEFYPRGIYSPVSSLLTELKKDAAKVLEDVSESLDARDQYRDKIQVWEMKGYDTSSLRELLDGDVNVLQREYDKFIKDVERLTELQKEFSSLDTSTLADEAIRIESLLFSPKHVDEVEKFIAKVGQTSEKKKLASSFGSFIIGESNKNAYSVYQEHVVKAVGSKFNPFIIGGKHGTGKTLFLQSIGDDMKSKNRSVKFLDLSKEEDLVNWDGVMPVDILILDNFHTIFAMSEERRKRTVEFVMTCIHEEKEVIIAWEKIPQGEIPDNVKVMFDLGLEVELNEPGADLAIAYIKSKIEPEKVRAIVGSGLPAFASFYEIDEYLVSYGRAPTPEVVPLGFEGEEIVLPSEAEAIEKRAPSTETVTPERPNKLNLTRYVFPDPFAELIDENY